jgi:outer membrane protein
MPAMKAAEAQLTKLREGYDAEYKKLVAEYQTKAAQYQEAAATAGDLLNQTRSQEMQDMGTRIQKYQDDASKSLQDKQIELQKPLTEKALAAIQKVARAKGVQYVLDSTVGSGVLLADGMDLLADVKKELGF